MSVIANLTKTSNLLRAVVVIVAFFPGIAMYRQLIEVPPDVIGVAQILSVSVSFMMLICIALYSEQIYKVGKRKVALFSFLGVILGSVCLLGYLQFAKTHIFTAVIEQGEKKFIIPLRPSDEVLNIVAEMDGNYIQDSWVPAIETGPRSQELQERLAEESLQSLIVMVALLIFSQVLLIAPPVAAAWRLAGGPGAEGAGDGAQAGGDPALLVETQAPPPPLD